MTQSVGRGIALLFHDPGTRKGLVVSSTPRPHSTPGKDPVPILQEAGWAPGPAWTGGKSRPHRDSIPDRPARSSIAIPTELPGPYNVDVGILKIRDRQCTYNAPLRRVRAITVAVGMECVLYSLTALVFIAFMSRDQNAGRIHSVRMNNSTFERVEEFKYLGTTLTNQNSIAEKI